MRKIMAYTHAAALLISEQLSAEGWVVELVRTGAAEWLVQATDAVNY